MALGRRRKQGKEEVGMGMGHEEGGVGMSEGNRRKMKWEKEQGWKGAWGGGRALPSHPPNGVHKHPQCGIQFSHSQGRKDCRVPSVPPSRPCSIPAVPPTLSQQCSPSVPTWG